MSERGATGASGATGERGAMGERGATSSASRVGWIVDVQTDFMDPAGRLYVRDLGDDTDPGAATIVPVLESVVAWMRERCAAIVYTGDWHGYEDAEIDAEGPDPALGTYPPHCMGRSPDPEERAGAEIIGPVRPGDGETVVLAHDASDAEARAAARRAVAEGRPIFVRKTRFNVFEGNPAAGRPCARAAGRAGVAAPLRRGRRGEGRVRDAGGGRAAGSRTCGDGGQRRDLGSGSRARGGDACAVVAPRQGGGGPRAAGTDGSSLTPDWRAISSPAP